MWHQLWPMHRGFGYVQNYVNGQGMEMLEDDIVHTYAPVLDGQNAEMYVARQWQKGSIAKENELLKLPGVAGLVFSSFRHDNHGPIKRNNWKA
jgi:hypothetical protein